MDYEKMSNEELYQLLLENYPEVGFKEVADYNRQTVIGFLTFHEGYKRGLTDVQPKDQ